jgi:isoquinoline 1-oxidoreductase beta subunit
VAWVSSYTDRHEPPDANALNYAIPHQLGRHVDTNNPVPWGPWRSVDHTLHGFYVESFMDELAHAAGMDPFEFRRAHLSAAPRHRSVLERAAAMSGWADPPPPNRARGIAIRESFGTIVAQVAEVSVGPRGRVRVHKLYSACDPGEVVNPATFAAQIRGGAIFGLSATLYGEITIAGGRVVERNFPDYEMVRMADAPMQEVSIIESGMPAGGAGEPGTPPVAAAVANAIFALTGYRIRELPLRKFDLRKPPGSA